MPGFSRAATLSLLAFSHLLAQLPPERHFDVASVKLDEDRTARPNVSTSGPRFDARAKSVYTLILYAYNLRSYQVPSTPALLTLENIRYRIAAMAGGATAPTDATFRQMVQSLLAGRFQLRAHREMREMPVYALMVAKNGPKLTASAADAVPDVRYSASGPNYVATMPKATMANVLDAIEFSLLDRPVLDQTGLKGTYNIQMTFAPDLKSKRNAEPDPEDISIFTAVEKLGLTLVPQKATVELLIVDQVEKPTEN